MEIEWHGGNRFKLRSDGTVVAMEMAPSDCGTADIVTRARSGETRSGRARKPFVIDGPGEYEVSDVFVIGVSSAGRKERVSAAAGPTIFAITADGVTVCHVGDGARVPSRADVDVLGPIDVLLLSPAAGDAGDGDALSEMIGRLDPAIIIPMAPAEPSSGVDSDRIARLVGGSGEGATELRRLAVTAGQLPEETQFVRLVERSADTA